MSIRTLGAAPPMPRYACPQYRTGGPRMSHDGLSTRAGHGPRETDTDRLNRRRGAASIAVFGAAALLTLAACGSAASSGAVGAATGTPEASVEASASAESSSGASGALNRGFITFQEQNGSKVTGGGTIIDLGDGSSAISLGIVAVGYADPLMARLVTGACTDAAAAPSPSFELPSAEPSAGASGAASLAP